MNRPSKPTRRNALKALFYGTLAGSVVLRESHAADAPVLTEDDPTAKALHYVTDVHKAKDAKPGSQCSNCALYTGDRKAAQGPCAAFAGKQVKAAGWCSAWTAAPK